MRRNLSSIVTNTIMVLTLFFIANLLQHIGTNNVYVYYAFRVFVVIIYDGLLAYWALGIMKRIMNVRVRRYMLGMAFLMMLWFVFRTQKWYVFTDPVAGRIMWYLYYIPILFIIYNNFMISEWLVVRDKKLQYVHGHFAFFVTLVLTAMVVTNEMHNFVFVIDKENNTYTHYIGYYIVASWMVGTILWSIVRLSRNSMAEKNDKRILAPIAVVLMGLLYCGVVLYSGFVGREMFVEFSAGFCLLIIAFMESLIQTGLIPSNIDYDWCFNHSSVRAQILDRFGNDIYESIEARKLTDDEIRELMDNRICHVDQNLELVSAPIKGGYVVWEKDIKDINYSIHKLNEMRLALKEATQTLEQNISIEKRHLAILERNRLYDITFVNVAKQLDYLETLVTTARTIDEQYFVKVLEAIDLIGVFVKRKSNLLLLGEQDLDDFTGELNFCFKESFDNLTDMGYEAAYAFNNVSKLNYENADFIYDVFETVLEGTLGVFKSIHVILSELQNSYILTVNEEVEGTADYDSFLNELKVAKGLFVDKEEDGNDITLSFYIRKGEKS